jgi:hypothetical protein
MSILPLRTIAYARSGDKGSSSNIGVIANTFEGYEFLEKHLTADIVNQYFKSLGVSTTVRYELPNLWALNFVLKDILAGGGSRSLRIDAQGKALGQAILGMKIDIPDEIIKLKGCNEQKRT